MPKGRPLKPLELTDDEHGKLNAWTRGGRTEQRLAQRARIVLSCAEGLSNQQAANRVGVSAATAGKWRERFRIERLEGLADQPRPGAPRKISDAQVEQALRTTLETRPEGKTHWSTRGLAAKTGLSQSSVGRIWRTFGLKPHRTTTFKLSNDPFFTEKVRDIVGLYMNPPEHAMVLCVDEKSQTQALERSQPLLPMTVGHREAATSDYVRHGTTSLFAALDTATGEVLGRCHRRHRQQEFIKFLNYIDRRVPEGFEVHLVVDNYATHQTPAVKRWFARRPHYHVHFTPTGASWLNLIESWFARITDECIRRGSFPSVRHLERAIHDYIEQNNASPQPFVWRTPADEIFSKIQRLCEGISDSGH